MKKIQPSPYIADKYWVAFRKNVHRLIAIGVKDAESLIRSTLDENAITGYLYHAIYDLTRFGSAAWCRQFEVKNESPLPSSTRSGNARRKADLIVINVFTQEKREFVLEAKPLNSKKQYQCENNYINEKALKRFLKGEYADYTAIYPEIGMLGYVLSDTAGEWRDKLKIAIDKNQVQLDLIPPQQDVNIINELPVEWTSKHQRDSSKNFLVIYHIMLDCCGSN
jgi:hypothetical protein